MAVGQVDIVVGVATLNNEETIAALLRTIDDGLTRHFPRARRVIVGADGGSNDRTADIVGDTSFERTRSGAGLRTRHQVAAAYRGIPGRASAIRLILTVADLLQARAVAVLDADATGCTPDWIGALLDPIAKQSFDLVAPVYGRHPLEGLLVTQLLRPLMRAAYGRQIDEPLLGEFSCSGPLASAALAKDIWDRSPIRDGIEFWLTGRALISDVRVCQAALGPRTPGSQRARVSLGEVFPLLVGALFACLDEQAGDWLPRTGADRVAVMGTDPEIPAESAAAAPSQMGATFRDDVRDLRPVLESILVPETFAALSRLVETGASDIVSYPDDVWVATVYDFLLAHHAGVMDRAHIAQALMPLYMGRTASFLQEHAGTPAGEAMEAVERLSRQFEHRKPYLVERWTRTT
jgi:hypothetical protein